jgi:hypothetical protein
MKSDRSSNDLSRFKELLVTRCGVSSFAPSDLVAASTLDIAHGVNTSYQPLAKRLD